MTIPKDAIHNLRQMQKQIICGKNTFGDIADLIESLTKERITDAVFAPLEDTKPHTI